MVISGQQKIVWQCAIRKEVLEGSTEGGSKSVRIRRGKVLVRLRRCILFLMERTATIKVVIVVSVFNFCQTCSTVVLGTAATLLISEVLPCTGRK